MIAIAQARRGRRRRRRAVALSSPTSCGARRWPPALADERHPRRRRLARGLAVRPARRSPSTRSRARIAKRRRHRGRRRRRSGSRRCSAATSTACRRPTASIAGGDTEDETREPRAARAHARRDRARRRHRPTTSGGRAASCRASSSSIRTRCSTTRSPTSATSPCSSPRASWPTWYLAAGTGTLFARTRWDDRAIWFVAECRAQRSTPTTAHPDAGNFVLSRGKDDVIVDPSPYGSLSTLTEQRADRARRAQLPAGLPAEPGRRGASRPASTSSRSASRRGRARAATTPTSTSSRSASTTSPTRSATSS